MVLLLRNMLAFCGSYLTDEEEERERNGVFEREGKAKQNSEITSLMSSTAQVPQIKNPFLKAMFQMSVRKEALELAGVDFKKTSCLA